MVIDLSLKNNTLYNGCSVNEVAGRLNLETPVGEAINIVGRNVNDMVRLIPPENKDEVVLTGPMAVWVYLIVFHAVVHAFTKVYYNDGRNQYLLSQHG